MKIVVAIDSFKGCLSSVEVNEAVAEGISNVCPASEIVKTPVSDGGEGFLTAFHAAIGGRMVELTVCDPLLRPVLAHYLLKNDTAVIEMAQASGLSLLKPEERNPLVATSYGTGQLVADAVRQGARHVIVGLGGSATSDAGIGMLRAIMDGLLPAARGELRSWDDVEALRNVRFTIASDVRNPLCGEQGAARVFAAQKGATEQMIKELDARARNFAEQSARMFGYDRSMCEGAGAAGGVGYAFLQYLDAEYVSGIQLLLDTIHFDDIIEGADLIITGEGSADVQTLMGKLPVGILQRSKGIPVCLLAGRVNDSDKLLAAGFASVRCINPPELPLQEALRKKVAVRNLSLTAQRLISEYQPS